MPKPVMNGKLAVRTYFNVQRCHTDGNFFPVAVTQTKKDEDGSHTQPLDFAVMKIVETENVDTHKRAMRQEVYVYVASETRAKAIAEGLQATIGTDADEEDDEKKEADYADENEFNLAPPGWGEIDADEAKNQADSAWRPDADVSRHDFSDMLPAYRNEERGFVGHQAHEHDYNLHINLDACS